MNSDALNARIPYATPDELSIIRELASRLDLSYQVVMIGAGPGVMLLALREGNPHCSITVIDIGTCRYAQLHLEENGPFPGHTNYIVADSAVYGAAYWSPERKIDFLIIDGDHSYNGVRRDLDAWLPHVSVNGYIFLHDFNADDTQFAGVERYPGVQQAVLESPLMSDDWLMVGRYGTALVLKRAA